MELVLVIFLPPTSKKLRGPIGLGLSVHVCVSYALPMVKSGYG